MIKKNILLIISLALFTQACIQNKNPEENDTPTPGISKDGKYYLHFDYINTTGKDPQITINRDSTSEAIQINSDRDIEFSNHNSGFLIDIFFKNLNIIADSEPLEITNIDTEILRPVGWEDDIEFATSFSAIPDLDLVVAIDASEPVSEDFASVKQAAKDFVVRTKLKAPDARIGVVSFANEINTQALSVNDGLALDFIDKIEQKPFRKLYEGMYTGISLLSPTSEAVSKVLVTFTDGRDNFSANNVTPSFLQEQLRTADDNDVEIKSYIIGMEDKVSVDQTILSALAINGAAEFPQTLTQMEQSFDNVSKLISTAYMITYQRNTQILAQREQIRFVITARKTSNSGN